jgi:hypothetical protein
MASFELFAEFHEMCSAVKASCDQRKLSAAEVTMELPKKRSILNLQWFATAALSAEFEKEGNIWREAEP